VPFLSRTLLVASRRKEPNEATPPRKVDGPAGELSAASCATGGGVSGSQPGVSGSPRSNFRSAASLVSTRCFTETSRTALELVVAPLSHDIKLRPLVGTRHLCNCILSDTLAFRRNLTRRPIARPVESKSHAKLTSKISASSNVGFATGTPSAPMANSRHKVGTRIPEKRWCPESTCAIGT
jgi:hypothetical protein